MADDRDHERERPAKASRSDRPAAGRRSSPPQGRDRRASGNSRSERPLRTPASGRGDAPRGRTPVRLGAPAAAVTPARLVAVTGAVLLSGVVLPTGAVPLIAGARRMARVTRPHLNGVRKGQARRPPGIQMPTALGVPSGDSAAKVLAPPQPRPIALPVFPVPTVPPAATVPREVTVRPALTVLSVATGPPGPTVATGPPEPTVLSAATVPTVPPALTGRPGVTSISHRTATAHGASRTFGRLRSTQSSDSDRPRRPAAEARATPGPAVRVPTGRRRPRRRPGAAGRRQRRPARSRHQARVAQPGQGDGGDRRRPARGAGQLSESDPAAALAHARAARRIASRVASVREAAGLAAYAAGEYAEALAELRAHRRMSGLAHQIPVMADCERALGRPAKALDLLDEAPMAEMPPAARAELLLVRSGAYRDLGQPQQALERARSRRARQPGHQAVDGPALVRLRRGPRRSRPAGGCGRVVRRGSRRRQRRDGRRRPGRGDLRRRGRQPSD